jgi:hypothetical protein
MDLYKNIVYLVLAILLIIFVWDTYNKDKKDKKETMESISPITKSGYFDSANYLIMDPKQTPFASCPEGTGVVNQLPNVCRLPTINNPLMNPAATEFGVNNLPAACNANDEDIQDEIKVNFNHELFRDVESEVWERRNSIRQFYTLPNTAIPNNQTEFANWLYRLPTSANCKEDTSACLRYDPKYDNLKYPN